MGGRKGGRKAEREAACGRATHTGERRVRRAPVRCADGAMNVGDARADDISAAAAAAAAAEVTSRRTTARRRCAFAPRSRPAHQRSQHGSRSTASAPPRSAVLRFHVELWTKCSTWTGVALTQGAAACGAAVACVRSFFNINSGGTFGR